MINGVMDVSNEAMDVVNGVIGVSQRVIDKIDTHFVKHTHTQKLGPLLFKDH